MAVRWGVVQPVGHRTVNADGGGSNPPAPAKLPSKTDRIGGIGRIYTDCYTFIVDVQADSLFPTLDAVFN
jgi:hypothetical protein